MERNIKIGTTIQLYADGKITSFNIDEVLGLGGSCVAYVVTYFESDSIPHKGVLKEYCPSYLDTVNPIRNDTVLNIPDEFYGSFIAGLNEFKNTYKYINQYLSENVSATNFHPVQIGLYEGNNTLYTLTSRDYGMTYDKVDDKNLLSICKIMLSVTKGVEFYHKAGFLHLDIKPKNILILDDVTDLIKLFDYDSLTSIAKIRSGDVFGIPAPEDYYVPELYKYEIRNIGIETDIFEIGAMLFTRIFKRVPTIEDDMSYDSVYDVDNNEFFIGVSPRVKTEFVELFKKTIQTSRRSRYKTTLELKNKLELIISLLDESKPYLLDLPKWQPSKFCVGRKDELKEIKRRLDIDGYVFVKGIGGLGKSEIAKLYAEVYKDEYHTIQFCKYTNGLKSVVATMQISGIDDVSYPNTEELIKEKNKVLHLADEKTLIVVDNFNVTYDDFLRDFLPSDNKSFKVIFTTRCSMASEYYERKTYELPRLSTEECVELFMSHSLLANSDNVEKVEQLIEYVDYNTLIIVLMAVSLKKSGLSVSDMLLKLEEQNIDSIETTVFHEYDFSSDEVNVYNRINAHLKTIFNVLALSETQKEIIKNATLISLNGIGLDDFIEMCSTSYINSISVCEVVDLGWLNKDSNNILTMHPIVSDLFSVDEKLPKLDSYYKFSDCLEDFCNPDYCHFSIVLNKLACAMHLDRRYRFETDAKVMVISAKLGRMYKLIYQPLEAKKYLKKALELAEGISPDTELRSQGEIVNFKGSYRSVFITYIYSFLGEIEKDFGTKDKAIKFYQKCISEGKKIENRFYSIVVESMMDIGECYRDNNNNLAAYNSYLEALNFAKRFKLKEYISEISESLIDICKDLDWTEREVKYRKVLLKYKTYAEKIEELPGLNEFSKTIDEKDFEGGIDAYEMFLSKQREKLGEDSPLYKDFKKGLWAYYAINKQTEKAMQLLSEALNFIASTHGKTSMEMANELASASNLLTEMAEFENAERFAKRALQICEKNKATNEYVYVEATFALATIFMIKGKLDEAMALVEKIDFTEFSGKEFLTDIVTTAGMVMCQLSRFDEIEPLCKEVLQKKSINVNGRFFSNIILAMICEQRGQLSEALFYTERAKQDASEIKTEHIRKEWLVAYYRSLARINAKKGKNKEAVKILTDFIDSFKEEEKFSFLLNGVYSDRALFYFYLGEKTKATKDFSTCERILLENKMPNDAFAVLYNNIAIFLSNSSEYEEALEYLNKILDVNHRVLEPITYFETVVCNNFGWIYYNLGRDDEAYNLLNKAVASFKKLGINNTTDYFGAKNNLALVCIQKEKYIDALNNYFDIRDSYDMSLDSTGEVAINTNYGIVLSLLKLNRIQEAYDFACEEINRFEIWFGETSRIRVQAIIQMGGLFREFGFQDCNDFFMIAEEQITKADDYKSLNYARLLNYIGVCKSDYEQMHIDAEEYLIKAKSLFEEINATNDEFYPVVIKNLKQIKVLVWNELINGLIDNLP